MKPRITVSEQVCHQSEGGEGGAVEWLPFSRELGSDEAPFCRPGMRVGPEWVPIDPGWLAGQPVGMLCLRNDGALPRATQPTDLEREADAGLIVELRCEGVVFALVRPGETCRFEPAGTSWHVCCAAGRTRVSYVLYPA
jgi:hypothetical protein